LLDPFGDKNLNKGGRKWITRLWQNALADHYQNNGISNVLYSQLPAATKQVISTKTIMQRFDNINKGKDYDNRIKPFNFFIVGVGNDEITPILPFTRRLLAS